MRFRIIPAFLFFLFICLGSYAQIQVPFYSEISRFKQADSLYPPQQGSILFIGSSSFTKWTDVQDYFPGYPILNRGFGGSTLLDLIRYTADIVYPYHPKQILIYCGENDLASSDTLSPETLLSRFKFLIKLIRDKYPRIQVDYISMKPSPSRWSMRDRLMKGNSLIREFLKGQKNSSYINIYEAMLDKKGQIRPELYLGDQLHMKPEGYKIWKEIILPYLKK